MSTLTLTEVKIAPIDAPLGAVVTGLDASQAIAPEVILQLKQALRDRHILIFKEQKLTDEQLFNFSLYFGALFVPSDETPVLASKPGETPVVIPISNVDGGYTGTGELTFHSDHKWTPTPSSGSLLYAVEIPSQGGDTYWLNTNLAYEALVVFCKALKPRQNLESTQNQSAWLIKLLGMIKKVAKPKQNQDLAPKKSTWPIKPLVILSRLKKL